MTHSISEVLLVDPLDPGIRDGLSTPTPEAGEVVFLLADEAAHEEGWPGRAAIAIARDWSAAGRRVILADADVTGASLHEQVGATNGEGVSDMVLYGASPSRVSRRPPGSGFLFMSAGTIVHEERSVYAHPRWPGLLGAFRESGCVLVMYVPHASESVRSLATEGDRVYRLTAHHPGSAEPTPGPAVDSLRATALITEIAPDANRAIDAEADFTDAQAHFIDAEADPIDAAADSIDAEAEALHIADEPGVAEIALGSIDADEPVLADLAPGFVEDQDVPLLADSWESKWVPPAREEEASRPPEDSSLAMSQAASPPAVPPTEEWREEGGAAAAEKPPVRSSAFVFSAEPAPARSLVNPLLLLAVFLLIIAAVLGAWLGYFAIPGLTE